MPAAISRSITLTTEPRTFAQWDQGVWRHPAGTYTVRLGHDAQDAGLTVQAALGDAAPTH